MTAVNSYNEALKTKLQNQANANNTVVSNNAKIIAELNNALKDAGQDEITEDDIPELPTLDTSKITDAESQESVIKAYNDALDAYQAFVTNVNTTTYEAYVTAVNNYNKSLVTAVETSTATSKSNTEKYDSNATKIDSALKLLKIIDKTDSNLNDLDIIAKPKVPPLTGNYDKDVILVAAYNDAVQAYNNLVAGADGKGGYNASVEEYNAKLAEYTDTLTAANAEQIQANKDSANAAVGGIDIVIKSNNETSDTIIETAYNEGRLSDYNFSSINDAKKEFAKRKNAVTTHQTKMAEALKALEAAVDESGKVKNAEAYAQAVKGYNQAVDGIKAAIISYNEFVGKCNVQSDGVPSTKPTETKEYKLDELYTDKWTQYKTYTTSSGTYRGDWSTATYYIQIQGTIPIEEGTTGHDSAGYVKAGAGAVADATIYRDHYNSLTGEVDDDYNRIDIPSSYRIISSNAYNNEVINLDHLVDDKGNPLGGKDATLSAKLQAYYANVYKVLINGKATNYSGTKTYSVPTADDAIKAMYKNGKMDSVTYQAYLDSVKKGTPSLDVVWYVIKDNRTNGNTVQWDGVHVDGAVFFTDTGIIYDKNKLTAINATFKELEDLPATKLSKLETLTKIGDLKETVENPNLTNVEDLKTNKTYKNTVDNPNLTNVKDLETEKTYKDTVDNPNLTNVKDLETEKTYKDTVDNPNLTNVKDLETEKTYKDTVDNPNLTNVKDLETEKTYKDTVANPNLTNVKDLETEMIYKVPTDFNGSLNPLNPITADSMKDSDDLKKLTELDTIDGRYIEQLGKLDPLSPIDPVVPSDEDDDSDDDFVVIVVPVDVPETMVQDAKPDAPVLPADPALPAVQDAHALPAVQDAHALPQTGVNWLAAIGLALSGMTLMITGAFASLLGKNAKH